MIIFIYYKPALDCFIRVCDCCILEHLVLVKGLYSWYSVCHVPCTVPLAIWFSYYICTKKVLILVMYNELHYLKKLKEQGATSHALTSYLSHNCGLWERFDVQGLPYYGAGCGQIQRLLPMQERPQCVILISLNCWKVFVSMYDGSWDLCFLAKIIIHHAEAIFTLGLLVGYSQAYSSQKWFQKIFIFLMTG